MESNSPRPTFFRRRQFSLKPIFVSGFAHSAFVAALSFLIGVSSARAEFEPPVPESEFLPAAPGEPPINFCSEWNPEFGYRGFRCCASGPGRNVASKSRRRRSSNACAPDRVKWTFCSDMTPAHRDYIEGVKSGRIDALEHIQKSMGSRGGQSFCGVSNGFLAEGRPLVPTEKNRIELRNEPRCANFGTDPMVGAFEWIGNEIRQEYHEPEFQKARLIIGDLSAPRGGCISGRRGRRAHKSHTSGVDIDLAFFNPRAGHPPEERFTRNFYVASNWWFLKKLFRNPFACVKVVFLDSRHISKLARYAKDDADWKKFRPFIRHVRGHRDHFHLRVGSGPGVAGCMSDPNLEEAEDDAAEEGEGFLVQDDSKDEDAKGDAGAVPSADRGSRTLASLTAAVDGGEDLEGSKSLASPVEIVESTLPPHKLEPTITAKYEARSKRSKKRSRLSRRSKIKRRR